MTSAALSNPLEVVDVVNKPHASACFLTVNYWFNLLLSDIRACILDFDLQMHPVYMRQNCDSDSYLRFIMIRTSVYRNRRHKRSPSLKGNVLNPVLCSSQSLILLIMLYSCHVSGVRILSSWKIGQCSQRPKKPCS